MEENFFNETKAAWWGAAISTILLLKEVYAWYMNRPNFDVSFYSTGEPGSDDKLIIYNDSTRIFSIISINLYSALKQDSDEIANHDIGRYTDFNITIVNPLQPHVLNIPDEYKFRIKEDKKLFAEIYVLGRKEPIIKQVY